MNAKRMQLIIECNKNKNTMFKVVGVKMAKRCNDAENPKQKFYYNSFYKSSIIL